MREIKLPSWNLFKKNYRQMKRMSKGIEKWNAACENIIGGCGLLSKRPSRYCSKQWPSYYLKAKGCKILSLDKNWYEDFSEFSIGCNILGYNNKRHASHMPNSVFRNALTTLLSPYEPKLAEALNIFFQEKLSWKFLRGGGEALALCI